MLGNIGRTSAVAAIVLLVALCSGCSISTEKTMYSIGIKAMKQDASFPQGAKVVAAPRAKCAYYVGKSEASIDIPYSADNSEAAAGIYTVWLKRIGTRWKFDRAGVVPKG